MDGDVENEVALIASGQSPFKNHAAVPLLDAVKEAHGKTKSLAGGILSWRHVLSKLEFEVSEGRFHACQIVADARDGHIKLLGRRRRRDGSETPLRGEVHPEACDPGHVIETRDGFEIKVAGLDVAAYIDLALERPDVDKHVKRLLAAGVTK